MIDKLSPMNFPLIATGCGMYGAMWSSPILTADTPETAVAVVNALNDYARLKLKVEREGPIVVTQRDMPDVNW